MRGDEVCSGVKNWLYKGDVGERRRGGGSLRVGVLGVVGGGGRGRREGGGKRVIVSVVPREQHKKGREGVK